MLNNNQKFIHFLFLKKKDNSGFTILELLVATLIFAIFMIAASAMFLYIQRGQEKVLIKQKLSDSHYFVIQTISHSLKNAWNINVPISSKIVFNIPGAQQEIYLKDDPILKDHIILNNILVDPGEEFRLTPPEVEVTRLEFILMPTEQEMITIIIEMQAKTAVGDIIDHKMTTNVSIR